MKTKATVFFQLTVFCVEVDNKKSNNCAVKGQLVKNHYLIPRKVSGEDALPFRVNRLL